MENKKMTTPIVSVGADTEQSPNVCNDSMRYYNLLTSGKLNSYLANVEQQAQDFFLRLVKDLAEKENVTEELKASDMMLWVQKMNNICSRAIEVVNTKLIFTV